jgi:hypothetical protein
MLLLSLRCLLVLLQIHVGSSSHSCIAAALLIGAKAVACTGSCVMITKGALRVAVDAAAGWGMLS